MTCKELFSNVITFSPRKHFYLLFMKGILVKKFAKHNASIVTRCMLEHLVVIVRFPFDIYVCHQFSNLCSIKKIFSKIFF